MTVDVLKLSVESTYRPQNKLTEPPVAIEAGKFMMKEGPAGDEGRL
jgi:hypothetical protein